MELQTVESLGRIHGIDAAPRGRGGIARAFRNLAAQVNASVVQPIRRELRIRQTVRQLDALDNRMLDDLGLVRWEIEKVVRENARASAARKSV